MYAARNRGRDDALIALGLIKTAGKGKILSRMGKWLWKKAPTWKGTKETWIGQPKQFAHEVAMGKPLAKGSLIRESFKTKTPLETAMFYGYPAYETGSVLLDNEGDKARRVGEALGGAAANMAMYRPFGMIGSMMVDPYGRRVGGAIGQSLGHMGSQVSKAVTKNDLGEEQQPAYTSNENVNRIGQRSSNGGI